MKIPARPRKFRNVPTSVGDVLFDSKREAARYQELRLLERAGEITALRVQPRYPLAVNGVPVCAYVGDFEYRDRVGALIVEDVKSAITRKHPVYRLKNKLFRAVMGFDITEV